ncbi:MAG: DUF2459 domain-containing protein [Moraxellaceae bacterium]
MRFGGRLLLFVTSLIALYGLAALLGGVVPVNRDYRPVLQGIPVYLQSNGAHIDIVFPVSDSCDCSRQRAPRFAVLEQAFDATVPASQWQWVAAGWGNEDFMLHVPTWSELTPGVALRAASGVGGSVLRLSTHYEPGMGEDVARLTLTPEQYRHLLSHIRASMGESPVAVMASITGEDDRFYRAQDRYSLFNTCNEWVRQAVAAAGIRTVWWTPFDGALLAHFGR